MLQIYLYPQKGFCCRLFEKHAGPAESFADDQPFRFSPTDNTWFILSDYIEDTEEIYFCPFCGGKLPRGIRNPDYKAPTYKPEKTAAPDPEGKG